MARKQVYRFKDGYTVWAVKNNLDDVFDPDKFHAGGIRSFRKFLNMACERAARQVAKNLFKRMCEMMAEDMLQHNDAFMFPSKSFGFIRIGDMVDHKLEDRLKVDEFERAIYGGPYGGIAVLSSIMRGVTGNTRLRFKLTQERMAQMLDLRDRGHRWQ